jgi:hypothetical protein
MKPKVTEGQALPTNRHSSLILGPSKAGKTTFARWLFKNPLWVAWDPDGVQSVRGTFPDDNIIWVPRRRPKEFLYDFLEKDLPERVRSGKYDGLVNDDLTHMSRLLTKQAAGWSYDLAQIQHYGKSISWIRDYMEKLKFDFVEISLAYVATDMYVQNEADSTFLCIPNVFGKDTFAPEIPAMVSNVFYCLAARKSKKQNVARDYNVLTVADGLRLAGNRLNVAGGELLLEAEIETTIWKKGGELINPIDGIRRVLEGEEV